MELSDTIRPLFLRAGWTPGRRVGVPEGVPLSHPAYQVLAEFGALRVGKCEVGEECASSDIEFMHAQAADCIVAWSDLLATTLVGIAEYHNGHGELYLDALGRCFSASLMHDAFCFEGGNVADALERVLLGRRARPMLRPDQISVDLYGVAYHRGDPRLFEYSD